METSTHRPLEEVFAAVRAYGGPPPLQSRGYPAVDQLDNRGSAGRSTGGCNNKPPPGHRRHVRCSLSSCRSFNTSYAGDRSVACRIDGPGHPDVVPAEGDALPSAGLGCPAGPHRRSATPPSKVAGVGLENRRYFRGRPGRSIGSWDLSGHEIYQRPRQRALLQSAIPSTSATAVKAGSSSGSCQPTAAGTQSVLGAVVVVSFGLAAHLQIAARPSTMVTRVGKVSTRRRGWPAKAEFFARYWKRPVQPADRRPRHFNGSRTGGSRSVSPQLVERSVGEER